MNLNRALRHVVENAKTFGPSAALHDLQQRAVNRIMPFQILRGMTAVMRDVNPGHFDPGPYQSRVASRDEVLAHCRPEYEMTSSFARDALDRGDKCFGMFEGDRMVSFGWYSNQPTHISDGLVLHFDPSWVYMYKGFTHPDYRGRRLHGTGMSLALAAFTAEGSRGLISYVKSNNFQSLRSIERMGYRIFGDVYLARVMGRPVTWSSPGCRPYGFRLEMVAARTMLEARA